MTLDTACPKPAKAPKRPRKPLQPSSHPIPRGRPKAVNRKRKASEFQRAYHSKERVAFVKRMACCWCAHLHGFDRPLIGGGSHNAHTTGGGMGRKGAYTTIVPLCPVHHRDYDEHRAPFNQPEVRQIIADCASHTEKTFQAWLAFAATLNSPQTESSLLVAGGGMTEEGGR